MKEIIKGIIGFLIIYAFCAAMFAVLAANTMDSQ